MHIQRIEIKNFKSFENANVDLNDFNVIVGAQASGKSNFVEAFQFLKDVSDDFEKGINTHGGPFFQNLNLESYTPSCIKVILGSDDSFITRANPDLDFKIRYNAIEYELCINFKDNSQELINESVKFNFNICRDDEKIYENSLLLVNKNCHITASFEREEKYVDLEYFVPKSLLNIVNDNLSEKHELIINTPLSAIPISWTNYFKSINYYDFDPKFCRLDDGNGKVKLSESGQNLPVVLENILNDHEKQRKYLNLVSILLPYIEKIDVFSLEDNRRMFRLSEKYTKSPVLSPFISDGTMNILALISALYFESGDIILIEEPERNIHPALFIQLVGMMKEVSQNKQVIITTHSPEILNYCDLEDIHLISRDSNGFSKISKPINNEEIKVFVDELGIGQIFVDDYLEFGNEL
ncbi:MAG: AAA family ATPase [Methanobrevibacter sp.]|uniref:AAA family ATPase n=1 Tax=Methanobrevibacter sp. TaxID=66852 RepID=UPI0025D010EF|nr:AAA family ATPase [Methanobrevibacter sp.]MBR0271092.1 AAA family ATPase [Methanobrevibacter sp.]